MSNETDTQDKPLKLSEAAKLFPIQPSRTTLCEWINNGTGRGGVRLRAQRTPGGQWWTTAEWVAQFQEQSRTAFDSSTPIDNITHDIAVRRLRKRGLMK